MQMRRSGAAATPRCCMSTIEAITKLRTQDNPFSIPILVQKMVVSTTNMLARVLDSTYGIENEDCKLMICIEAIKLDTAVCRPRCLQ